MDELFYWLLNMSIVASLAGIVIVLLRAIKRIPRRLIVILWAIPFFRFWLPVGVGGKFSLMSLLSRFAAKSVVVYENAHVDFSMMNSVQAADSYFPITFKASRLADLFRYAAVVWAIIAAAWIIVTAMIYISTRSELRTAELLRGNVYCSEKAATPAVYGIIRPMIVLPESCRDTDELDMILLHEQLHIRRLDNLWRLLAFLTAAIHWFNPLAWLFLKLYLSDIELACDESVLSRLPAEERGRYAHTLLNTAERQTVFASALGGAKIRSRIEHIISFRRITTVSAIRFGALVAGIAYVLLTNAA